MRALLTIMFIALCGLKAVAQTEAVANLPFPVRTVHYQSGTTPVGAFPIWTTRGVYYYGIFTDTLHFPKQAALNETMTNKLLWIKTNGDVSAWTPDYMRGTDTTSMLLPYLRKQDTTGRWAPNLPYLLSFTESDPLSVHVSDSSLMLSKYLRKVDTTNHWAPKLPYLLSYTETDPKFVADSSLFLNKIMATLLYQPKGNYQPAGSYITSGDTINMLAPYLRKNDTITLSNRIIQSVTKSDTLPMLAPYLRKIDTIPMLSPYIRAAQAAVLYYPVTNPTGYITSVAIAGKLNSSDTTNKWAFKAAYLLAEVDPLAVKKTDSAAMLSPYIRTAQANAFYYPLVGNPSSFLTSASITGKVNVSDTAAMLSPYAKLFQLALKVNLSDTASMLSPYAKLFQLATKVNISDTATMLSGYLRKTTNIPSFNNAATLTIGTGKQISTTRTTLVTYTISVASVVSIGQAIGFLEVSPDNVNWTTINSAGETSVALLNTKYYNLQGSVQAGYYVRIRSAVTLGGVVAFVSGQEMQIF